MTNSSAEATGPRASRATPGASAIDPVSSRLRPLVISESAARAHDDRSLGGAGAPSAAGSPRRWTARRRTRRRRRRRRHAAADDPRRCRIVRRFDDGDGEDLRERVHVSPSAARRRCAGAWPAPRGAGRRPARAAATSTMPSDDVARREVEDGSKPPVGSPRRRRSASRQPSPSAAAEQREQHDSSSTSASTRPSVKPSVFSTRQLAGPLAHRLRHGVAGDQQDREEHRGGDAAHDQADVADLVGESCDEGLLGSVLVSFGELANSRRSASRSPAPASGSSTRTMYQPTRSRRWSRRFVEVVVVEEELRLVDALLGARRCPSIVNSQVRAVRPGGRSSPGAGRGRRPSSRSARRCVADDRPRAVGDPGLLLFGRQRRTRGTSRSHSREPRGRWRTRSSGPGRCRRTRRRGWPP